MSCRGRHAADGNERETISSFYLGWLFGDPFFGWISGAAPTLERVRVCACVRVCVCLHLWFARTLSCLPPLLDCQHVSVPCLLSASVLASFRASFPCFFLAPPPRLPMQHLSLVPLSSVSSPPPAPLPHPLHLPSPRLLLDRSLSCALLDPVRQSWPRGTGSVGRGAQGQ